MVGGQFENSVSPGPETEMEYGFWTKKWDLNLELDNLEVFLWRLCTLNSSYSQWIGCHKTK